MLLSLACSGRSSRETGIGSAGAPRAAAPDRSLSRTAPEVGGGGARPVPAGAAIAPGAASGGRTAFCASSAVPPASGPAARRGRR